MCGCGAVGEACCNGTTCSDDGDSCNGVEVCQGPANTRIRSNAWPPTSATMSASASPRVARAPTPPRAMARFVATVVEARKTTLAKTASAGRGPPSAPSVNGAWVRPAAATGPLCPTGCCANNQCQPGTADTACGGPGPRTACGFSQICQSHSCAACGGANQVCCRTGGGCGLGLVCDSTRAKCGSVWAVGRSATVAQWNGDSWLTKTRDGPGLSFLGVWGKAPATRCGPSAVMTVEATRSVSPIVGVQAGMERRRSGPFRTRRV